MRNYSKVAPTFWTGATGRAIRKRGQDATILALYLITNPHANMYGLYYLPLPLIAHETGIPLEGASKGLRSLFQEGYCLYDEVVSGNTKTVSSKPKHGEVVGRRQTASSGDRVDEGLSGDHAIHRSTLPDQCSPGQSVTDMKNRPMGRVKMQSLAGEIEKPSEIAVRDPPFLLTRRKRKLTGWKLKAFEEFWETFAHKKGRAEAADAWLDIPELAPELAKRIIDAAGREARARPALISKGQTPKWAQGWLSARRWEDWEGDSATTHDRDGVSGKEVNHDARKSRSREEERAEYLESLTEALKRFM
jgi:hypothetical protein